MANPKTGFVVRALQGERGRNRVETFLRPCGAGSGRRARAVDAKIFASADEAEAFGHKMSGSHRAGRVEGFTVEPIAVHTLKVAGDELELIRQALAQGTEEMQQLGAALFAQEGRGND
ncbi:MAG: hypothetical protein RLZZ631_1300 [Cyanobacteriota bacterium]|jgi:hypothetical protein